MRVPSNPSMQGNELDGFLFKLGKRLRYTDITLLQRSNCDFDDFNLIMDVRHVTFSGL